MKIIRLTLAAILPVVSVDAQVPLPVPSKVLHTIVPPPPGRGAQFGYSVAIDGDLTVIGAPFANVGADDAGVVKVFNSDGELIALLSKPGAAAHDRFGHAVAISGMKVAVGVYGDDTGAENAGSVYVFDLASLTRTVPVATLHNPSPGPNDNFGWSVAISGNRVVAGAYLDDAAGAENSGSAYAFDLSSATPAVPIATLQNPTGKHSEEFGASVAISGALVVAGAPFSSTAGTLSGSAYVYDLTSATPAVPVLTLNNPEPAVSDLFGTAVGISGMRVVIGSPGNATKQEVYSGSVYVYDSGSATPAVPLVTIDNPEPKSHEYFGRTVAISGSLVVAGATGDDTGTTETERACVFDLTNPDPASPVVTLNNPAPGTDDFFGNAVALSGTRLVVGAHEDDARYENSGNAYIYELMGGISVLPLRELNRPDVDQGARFGHTVAISGSLMVTGSPHDDAGGPGAGTAFVYDLSAQNPTVPAFTLTNPSPKGEAGKAFGYAVAISGTRVVVGTPGGNASVRGAGIVRVYDLAGATPLVPVVSLQNPSPNEGDSFGAAVAISGTRIVAASKYNHTGAGATGAAWVYDLSSATPTVPVVTLQNPGPAVMDSFGNDVAISGTRVVVGAVRDHPVVASAGRVYVYDLAGATPGVPALILNNAAAENGDLFGLSVSISGTRVVVGATTDGLQTGHRGSALVYNLDGPEPGTPVVRINNPAAAGNGFGKAVSISGTRVLVGAYQNDPGATDAGSAYVYDLSSDTPAVPLATLNNPAPATDDYFGNSVAIDGTSLVVGAPLKDMTGYDSGAVYFYGPNPNDLDADELLDSWETEHFHSLSGPGPLDDSDGDGFNNLLEEAFGTDPLAASGGGVPAAFMEDGYLTITLTKRPGVLYTVQSAGDLSGTSFSTAFTRVLVDSAATLTVRDDPPAGSSGRRFLRVNVTAAP